MPLTKFWTGEDYHQNHIEKNPFDGYVQMVGSRSRFPVGNLTVLLPSNEQSSLKRKAALKNKAAFLFIFLKALIHPGCNVLYQFFV